MRFLRGSLKQNRPHPGPQVHAVAGGPLLECPVLVRSNFESNSLGFDLDIRHSGFTVV